MDHEMIARQIAIQLVSKQYDGKDHKEFIEKYFLLLPQVREYYYKTLETEPKPKLQTFSL